ADLFAWQIRRHIAFEQPKPPSGILHSFLGKYGVNGNITGPYLDDLVRNLNNGLLLKDECLFFLPKDFQKPK
ncbi:MAG: hypothetical protein ACREDR_38605, partial [Blastocatellia bacterium]